MKIFKSKKIMTAAIAVFVISSIGLTTAAFSSDQMKKSSKTNTPALSGLTTEELHSTYELAAETQAIVITQNADQTTAASTAATTAASTAATTAPAATPAVQTETSDNDDNTDATAAATTTAVQTNTPALAELSADNVKQIVSAKTPDAIITELKLDEDDGKLTYDVKATLGQIEYEYKIDAYTGVILEYKTDVNDINDADDIDVADGIDDADDMEDVAQIDDKDELNDENKVDDVNKVDVVDDVGEND